MERKYFEQVSFLVRILPEIARIPQFALHGGTAINLFYHNMPRLSVDIDLTYIPYGERSVDLHDIQQLLKELAQRLIKTIPGVRIQYPTMDNEKYKLYCYLNAALVKVEVNTINRGLVSGEELYILCQAAQESFDSFVEMRLVPKSQLFGGKIVAALDRQHPRDLYDTKKLLDSKGLNEDIMKGFLFCLLSSNRPFHEVLQPVLADQKSAMENQFRGMINETFTYNMYESERLRLVKTIQGNMTTDQKRMLLSVLQGNPDWIYGDWSTYPGIAWKIKNLALLKTQNPVKYSEQKLHLERLLNQ